MYKGGTTITPRSAQIFRFAGLFIPIILIAYGVLTQFDIINVSRSINAPSLYLFLFWWLFVSLLQFFVPSKTKLDCGLRLAAIHLLAGSYLIFISGVASPFLGCWLLLMLASYLYFSERGLQLSTLAFVTVIVSDIALWHEISESVVIYDLVALVAILMTSLVTLSISRSQQISRAELNRSKAQESLQRDRVLTIINNMTDAVFSTDMDGIIRVYNAACLNLLDTNDNLNGRHIDEVLPLTDQEGTKVILSKEFQTVKTVMKRDDLSYSFSDDEKVRLEVTFSPIRSSYSRSKKSETHDGYIVIMRDITKSKSLEEERDEFISVTSHELRTPVAIAEGAISNLQVMMEHPDVTNSMLQDAVKTAHDQIMFLANMVNDLSTLSRADRGIADKTEIIDAQELAHKLFDKYHDEAKAKKLHLDLDLSPKLGKVCASRLYLEELLQNFITNAIKYTKEGNVKIIVKQKDGIITFSVKDTGIGISKADQAKVYGKFYRSEDYRTRETGGTGLGLYIASKLAHKLNTKIQLTSRLNFGSNFSIALPEIKEQTTLDE